MDCGTISIREAFKGNLSWNWKLVIQKFVGAGSPNLSNQVPELKNPPTPIADTQKPLARSGLIGWVGAGLLIFWM
ncbi:MULTISPECIES: hypothetical protein [unclassified Microcoleus]|uniref:hypothetical protein n=1 Tax=unclassified Microcoleus TaxID=2642155 RepID=UPI002FD3EE61